MNDENQAGWDSLQFGDVITYHNSGVYKSKELYGDQGENIIGISQLYSSLFVDGEVYKRVPLTLAEQKKHTLHENDLLYGESSLVRSGIARTVCVTSDGEGTAFAWHTRRLKIDQRKAYSPFLAYLLELDETRAKVESVATQTALTGITTKDYFGIPLRLPTLDCQRKVAKILATVDNLIDQTQNLIDKYTAVKQGMMADLFSRGVDLSGTPETNNSYGQLRPNHVDAPELYQETEFGWIPKDWNIISLEDHFSIKHGYAFKGEYFSDKPPGKVLLTPGNFFRHGGLYFESKNTKYYNGPIPSEYVLENGDFLVVMTDLSPQTLILGRFVLLNEPMTTLHNQRIGRLEKLSNLYFDQTFLLNALNQETLRKEIVLTATGTTVRHSSPQRILNNKIQLPKSDEQKAIGKRISQIETLIFNNQTELAKYQKIKKGLMQDLLTGKVKV